MPSSANPAMDSTTVSNGLEIKKKIDVCRDLILGIEGGKSGLAERLHDRLCSHFGPVHWFRTVVITLLLVSFVSHLLLHVQLGQVREESREQQDKIEDLVEASRLILNADSGQQPSLKTTSKLDTDEKLQRSRTLRRARRKRNVPASPNFFFRGRPGVNPSTNNGYLLWVNDGYDEDSFHLEWSGQLVKSVKIRKSGVYFVFAKVGVNGVANLPSFATDLPPRGLMLKKTHRRHGYEMDLERAFLTQDNRGMLYNPLDTLPVSGMFLLHKHEKLFVKVPDHPLSARYDLNGNHTHFGGFMVQSMDD